MEVKNAVLAKIESSETRTPNISSPRPTPVFFFKEQTFSTKKERQTPKQCPPPTPRPRTTMKSCPPSSQLFAIMFNNGPMSVSFRTDSSKLSSEFYDEKKNSLYFDQCFDSVSKIGSGSFGEVFRALSKEDSKYYAVKRSKERFRGRSDRLRKLEEVKKHEQLPQHENCVQFIKAWEEKGYLYIQTELCETSLSQYTEENHDIPEATVWNYLADLLLAVKHLHDHNLVHLDIKPDNIFITENGVCKLGDFGLVFDISKGDTGDALEGDPKYLAPELMQGHFSKAADVFSLGITILELACDLDLPRGDSAWHELRQGKIPSDFIKGLSPQLTDVICRMMEPDYRKRPTVNDVVQMKPVSKIYRRRKFGLALNTILSYLFVTYCWLAFLSCWIKSFLLTKFPFFRKSAVCPVVPEQQKDKKPRATGWDYSFSDDELCENERFMGGVRTKLFKDEAESAQDGQRREEDEAMACRPVGARESTPSPLPTTSFHFFDDSFDDPTCSPTFRNLRPCMSSSPKPKTNNSPYPARESPFMDNSPKSARRSARLASRQLEFKTSGVSPRNLMDAFNDESSDISA